MFQFFNDALDFFKSIASFIKMVVDSVVKFFAIIPRVTVFGSTVDDVLPAFLAPFLGLAIALIIVKLIIDRL